MRALVIVGSIAAIGFLIWFFWPTPPPSKAPDNGAVELDEGKSIAIDSKDEPALPPGYKPRAGDKIVTVKAKEDIKAGSEVKILIPRDGPVYVLGDSGRAVVGTDSSRIEVTYRTFRDPWFHIEPHILVGASLNKFLEPSPFMMASCLTVFGKAHLGGALDRFGCGPAAGYEILDHLDAIGKYNVLDWHDRPAQFSIAIAYRF